MPSAPRTTLVICRSAPCGSTRAADALDVAMAFGAFEQPVSLLFLGDGVLALLPGQEPGPIGARSLARIAGALPDYGIERVCVEASALAARGLADTALAVPVEPLPAPAIAALIAAHEIVLTV